MLTTLAVFVLILGLLIVVHEFGHFWLAKRSGVTVLEFAFGFKPRLWAWRRAETEYSLNLIPFGGYVRLEGEMGQVTSRRLRSFMAAPPAVRARILAAGVAMNFVLAFGALYLAYAIGGTPLTPTFAGQPLVRVEARVAVDRVVSGSPAERAGLRAGDRLAAIDGRPLTDANQLIRAIAQSADRPVEITVERAGRSFDLTVRPRVSPPAGEGPTGLALIEERRAGAPWTVAYIPAAGELAAEVRLTLSGLSRFVRQTIATHRLGDEVSGVIGVASATGVVRRLGFGAVAQFVAIISVNLALINLLPLPPLDGGHLLFIALESLARRELTRVKSAVTTAGLVGLVLLIVAITYSDFTRFAVWQRLTGAF